MDFDYPGIYRIDGPNNCVYIGSAVNIRKRWNTHKSALRIGMHRSLHMQRAWNKYGEDAFTFSVIDRVDDKTRLLHYEQIWLDVIFQSLDKHEIYNTATVSGSRLGIPCSDETRARLALASKGNKNCLGRKASTETRLKQSLSHLGKRGSYSSEHGRAVSASKKGIATTVKTYNIVLISPMGEQFGPITNLFKFCREHSLTHPTVLGIISGKYKQHKGWTCQQLV